LTAILLDSDCVPGWPLVANITNLGHVASSLIDFKADTTTIISSIVTAVNHAMTQYCTDRPLPAILTSMLATIFSAIVQVEIEDLMRGRAYVPPRHRSG